MDCSPAKQIVEDGINEENHETESETEQIIKDVVDYLVELVSNVIPEAPRPKEPESIDEESRSSDVITLDSDDESPTVKPQEEESLTCEVELTSDPEEHLADKVKPLRDRCCVCLRQPKDIIDLDEENRENEPQDRAQQFEYQLVKDGVLQMICSKRCLTIFNQDKYPICGHCARIIPFGTQGYLSIYNPEAVLCSEECLSLYEISQETKVHCCARGCRELIENIPHTAYNKMIYGWQGYDVCSLRCLEVALSHPNGRCINCFLAINRNILGKYAVRFGVEIKQFCSAQCLNAYKTNLKVCSFCQNDLKNCKNILVAQYNRPDGQNPEQTQVKRKEFCDQTCKCNFEKLLIGAKNKEREVECSQCSRYFYRSDVITVAISGQAYTLCSMNCVNAFRFSHSVKLICCEGCHKFADWKVDQMRRLRINEHRKVFCSDKCLNLYVLKNRKISSCATCKVKKYNFDLIEKYSVVSHQSKFYCSLNCTAAAAATPQTLLRIGTLGNAKCNTCTLYRPIEYRHTFDGEDKLFCSLSCSFKFQKTYVPRKKPDIQSSDIQDATPSGSLMWTPSLMSTPSSVSGSRLTTQTIPVSATHPVASLLRPTTSSPTILQGRDTNVPPASSTNSSSQIQVREVIKEVVKETKELIIKIPPPREMKSKGTLFKASSSSKAISCRPISEDASCQTDPVLSEHDRIPIFIPIPFPTLLPVPISVPTPFLWPLPIPVPIPFFMGKPSDISSKELAPGKQEGIKELSQQPKSGSQESNTRRTSEDDNFMELLEQLCSSDANSEHPKAASNIQQRPQNAPQHPVTHKNHPTSSASQPTPTPPSTAHCSPARSSFDVQGERSIHPISYQTSSHPPSAPVRSAHSATHDLTTTPARPPVPLTLHPATNPARPTPPPAHHTPSAHTFSTPPPSHPSSSTPGLCIPPPIHSINNILQSSTVAPGSCTLPVKRPYESLQIPEDERRNLRQRKTEEPPQMQMASHQPSHPVLQNPHHPTNLASLSLASSMPSSSNLSLSSCQYGDTPSRDGISLFMHYFHSVANGQYDLTCVAPNYLNAILVNFFNDFKNRWYISETPDSLASRAYRLSLEIQQKLVDIGRLDNIFMDPLYDNFSQSLHQMLTVAVSMRPCISESTLWSCGQLGPHSPTSLLFTVMYMVAKHFRILSLEDHQVFTYNRLERTLNREGKMVFTCLLRNQNGSLGESYMAAGSSRRSNRTQTISIAENKGDPFHCPVKLIEFYFCKCPPDMITAGGLFYLEPIYNVDPNAQFWYNSRPLSPHKLSQMLRRIQLVADIN